MRTQSPRSLTESLITKQKLEKIYQLLKAKIEISSRKFLNHDDCTKIIVSDHCSWIIRVQKGQAKLSKIETPDYEVAGFDNIFEFGSQVIIEMFGKELLCWEYLDKCFYENKIVILKENNINTILQIFIEFPFIDINLEFDKIDSFDLEHSIHTTGYEDNIYIGTPLEKYNTGYLGTPINTAKAALESLNIQCQEFRFIELGCGKGRVVILAAFYPFKQVVGIEYSKDLSEIAKSNVNTLSHKLISKDIEIHTKDARDHDYENDDSVFFLYESFSIEVFCIVLEKIYNQIYLKGRKVIFIMIANGLCEQLDQCSWLELTNQETPDYILGCIKKSGWLIFDCNNKLGEEHFNFYIYRSK